MSNDLSNVNILVTGVGLKPAKHEFRNKSTGNESSFRIGRYKANIGAATSYLCAMKNARVHMVARNVDNLKNVKGWIDGRLLDRTSLRQSMYKSPIHCHALDLNDLTDLDNLVASIPNDRPLYWVQSLGVGAGTVEVKGDNPYVPLGEVDPALVRAELSVYESTLALFQRLLPRFLKQLQTRVVIISSMSAARGYGLGTVHCAAKAAISHFANAAMIELAPKDIFVTTILPGAVDTGLYDPPEVQEAAAKVAAQYDYIWWPENGGLQLMSPTAVAEQVVGALTSEAHVTEIKMVACGQFPHGGS